MRLCFQALLSTVGLQLPLFPRFLSLLVTLACLVCKKVVSIYAMMVGSSVRPAHTIFFFIYNIYNSSKCNCCAGICVIAKMITWQICECLKQIMTPFCFRFLMEDREKWLERIHLAGRNKEIDYLPGIR